MGGLIGFLVFLIGIALLAAGLGLPQALGSAAWKTVLGIVLSALGFGMADFSGSHALPKLMAFLLALLGVALLAVSLCPTMLQRPLYGGMAGIGLRAILGILFCLAAYAVYELGEPD